jgi:tRNA threonylcarbamoyladenosine biosynthesis protein TsaE
MPEATVQILLDSEAATEQLGRQLAAGMRAGMVVFLRGELGAGKTTLVRGVLRALGVSGPVKSPTYTLVELYRTPQFAVHHFDLYRLRDPQELEEMGIRDYLSGDALVLIEWPQRGVPVLPAPDLEIALESVDGGAGRQANLRAATPAAQATLHALQPEHMYS